MLRRRLRLVLQCVCVCVMEAINRFVEMCNKRKVMKTFCAARRFPARQQLEEEEEEEEAALGSGLGLLLVA